MNSEYVDVFSDKYTKWWKRFAITKFVIKISIDLILIFGLIVVCKVMVPYVKGVEEWAEAPFTLSQINALICVFTFAFLTMKAMKMYSRW